MGGNWMGSERLGVPFVRRSLTPLERALFNHGKLNALSDVYFTHKEPEWKDCRDMWE
jgi:hypothetical protein